MFILTKFPLSLQQTEKAREKEVKATKLKDDETHTGRDVEKGVAYTEKLLAGHAVEVKRCQNTMERVGVCECSAKPKLISMDFLHPSRSFASASFLSTGWPCCSRCHVIMQAH